MKPVPASERASLLSIVPEETPGPQTARHAIRTGRGECFADRVENPRLAVVQLGIDGAIFGDPRAVDVGGLSALGITGSIEAAPTIEPILRRDLGEITRRERVIGVLTGEVRAPAPAPDAELRRLGPDDARHVGALPRPMRWIHKPFGGPSALAGSGIAHGVFAGGELVAIATPFTWGERYEDLAVVTREDNRGRGFATAAGAAVVEDVRGRGRVPAWSTDVDSRASLSVARKLGFVFVRRDLLYVTSTARAAGGRPVAG